MLEQIYVDDSELTVCITSLQNLKDSDCLNVRDLYLYDSLKVTIGHDIVNEDILERQYVYREALSYLYKFRNVKRIHFLNTFIDSVPESVITLESLEEMSILFINNSDSKAQIQQLLKIPKLRFLILNEDFIGEIHFTAIKKALASKNIKVISD